MQEPPPQARRRQEAAPDPAALGRRWYASRRFARSGFAAEVYFGDRAVCWKCGVARPGRPPATQRGRAQPAAYASAAARAGAVGPGPVGNATALGAGGGDSSAGALASFGTFLDGTGRGQCRAGRHKEMARSCMTGWWRQPLLVRERPKYGLARVGRLGPGSSYHRIGRTDCKCGSGILEELGKTNRALEEASRLAQECQAELERLRQEAEPPSLEYIVRMVLQSG